jgi:hypothetical protein
VNKNNTPYFSSGKTFFNNYNKRISKIISSAHEIIALKDNIACHIKVRILQLTNLTKSLCHENEKT